MAEISLSVAIPVIIVLGVITCVICFIASILCIRTIYRLEIKNGYMILVKYLNYFQLLNVVVFFTQFCAGGDFDFYLWSFSAYLCTALGTAFISNLIVITAWYVVAYKKNFDVVGNFPFIMLPAILPGLVCSIVYLSCGYSDDDGNCDNFLIFTCILYIQIISIAFSFVLIIIMMYQLQYCDCLLSEEDKTRPERVSELSTAIRTVVSRLIWYPIAKMCSEIGYLWYLFRFAHVDASSGFGIELFIAFITYIIVTPSASVAFLCIVLHTQPKAYDHFLAILHGYRIKNTDESEVQQENEKEKAKEDAKENDNNDATKEEMHPRESGNDIFYATNDELFEIIEQDLFRKDSDNIFTANIELRRSESTVENPIRRDPSIV